MFDGRTSLRFLLEDYTPEALGVQGDGDCALAEVSIGGGRADQTQGKATVPTRDEVGNWSS